MPAMPLTSNAYEDFAGYDGTKNTSYNPECQGLTKFEHFAGLAMQGLVTAQDEGGTWAHDSKTVALTAVSYAKALLAELDKVNDDE